MQKHTTTLNETVEKLSDESSYRQLFHPHREEEAALSSDAVKEIVELCRAILFPGYFGNARIGKQMIRFHTGVNIGTLHDLLSGQIYAGLCFSDKKCAGCRESEIRRERAESLSETFIAFLPELRNLLAMDVEAALNNGTASQNIGEVIFCYPGVRAVINYRIAHQLYKSGVPFIPRMISEMAHSETGIDIHPGAQIGPRFSISHGTGTVIGETSVVGKGVTVCGSAWIMGNIAQGATLKQRPNGQSEF
ncbi:MAG: serine acetyltransferase [Tannerellaceae bacterium]|jgi:serine O-acetyltransferase|nr:serine acetyltransferase [Tannerellaceae bacterium]